MNWKAKLEAIANLATIAVAVLLGAVLIKVYLLPAPATPRMAASSGAVAVGTSLKGKIPDVDWSRNGRTLVLALSTTCHFCRESGPFYRRLQQEVKGRVKVLAILPQTESEGAQYLGEAGFNVDQVKQAVLPDIGVHGTPTMMLVDAKGRVTRIWFGKLQQQQEEEVLRTLRSAA